MDSALPFSSPKQLRLSDGTPVLIRPIRPDGGPKLAVALERLSLESSQRRFLFPKRTFSESELDYLTQCDGVDHLALVVVILDAQGEEIEPVAVARCVRDVEDGKLAELAIVVADEWQLKGIGNALLAELAAAAYRVGIRRWRAFLMVENEGTRRMLKHVGKTVREQAEGYGIAMLEIELKPA